VHTGTTAAQKKLFFNFRRLRNKIHRVDNPLRRERPERITSELCAHLKDAEMMEGRFSEGDLSLDGPLSENGEAEWQYFIINTWLLSEKTVFEHIDEMNRPAWLREAPNSLSKREHIIIRARRLRDKTVTLAVLGQDLGIGKGRVR